MIFKFAQLKKFSVIFTFIFLTSIEGFSQSDSMLLADEPTVNYIRTFDGTRVINGQSPETLYKRELQFMISHRFGTVSGGVHTLFGLDQSNVRLGFDYGLSDRMTIGVGRSSQKETYDGYLKFKVLRQSTGAKKMPLSLTLFAASGVMTNKKSVLDTTTGISSRLAFVYQVVAAKKIGRVTIQLSPTLVYRNQIESSSDQFYTFAVGFAGRYKINNMFSLTGEYFYTLPGYVADHYYNSASIGIDIQTGGHVFQIHFSNSQGMIEQFYVLKTTDNWSKNGMRLGFNVTRVFSLGKKKGRDW